MISDLIQKLKPFLTHDDGSVKAAAAKALSRLQAKEFVSRALGNYATLSEEMKTRILSELSEILPEAYEGFLQAALADPLPSVRAHAVRAAGECGDPKFLERIAPLTRDANPVVRKLSYEFLARFPLPKVIELLNASAQRENNAEALESLIRAIGAAGHKSSLPILGRILETRNEPALAAAVIESIGKLKI